MALPVIRERLEAPAAGEESLYHVTVLSNFARAFDKYSMVYSKARIPESTFPDRFFLLRQDEVEIGVAKASRLLGRLGLEGDRLIVRRRTLPPQSFTPTQEPGSVAMLASAHSSRGGAHAEPARRARAVVDRRRDGAIAAGAPPAAPALRGLDAEERVAIADRSRLPGSLRLLLFPRVHLSRARERPLRPTGRRGHPARRQTPRSGARGNYWRRGSRAGAIRAAARPGARLC